MRIAFLGTPSFAVPSLQALFDAGHEIPAVFTQPDRPKGRGNTVSESPVKTAALQLGLPVLQPERIRRSEGVELLKQLGADLMVVVGYGQIIPQSIIDLPRLGILNVHASLLPKYRGAAPIQWALAEGEKRTGVTIMQIDAGLDTGDMLATAETAIQDAETAPELSVRLAVLGAPLLIQTIQAIEDGTAVWRKQDSAEATNAPILNKDDGLIDWQLSAESISNRLRGFTPWPGAYTFFRGVQLSILRVTPLKQDMLETETQPGVLHRIKKHLYVGCGMRTALELHEVQPAGKKRMSAEAWSNGYQFAPGERLQEGLGEEA